METEKDREKAVKDALDDLEKALEEFESIGPERMIITTFVRARIKKILDSENSQDGKNRTKTKIEKMRKNKAILYKELIDKYNEGHTFVELPEKWTNFLRENNLINEKVSGNAGVFYFKEDKNGNTVSKKQKIDIRLSDGEMIEFEFKEGAPESYIFKLK